LQFFLLNSLKDSSDSLLRMKFHPS